MRADQVVAIVATVVGVVVFGGGIFYLLLAQFRMRGQGWVSWVLLTLAGANPIYPLILLALLPNKRRAAMRDTFAAELDEKLAAAASPPRPAATVDFPMQSVGDLPTNAPGS